MNSRYFRFETVLGCLNLAIFLAGANAAPAEAAKPAAGPALIRELDDAFVHVYEKVAPAVVVIEAYREAQGGDAEGDATPPPTPGNAEAQHVFRLPEAVNSESSGFIMRPDGYILTNNHAIADAGRIEVRLKDGRTLPATLVGADDKTDVAVLKIAAVNLPVVEFGDSDALRVGQMVGAIGVPFNLDYSFTVGWVSAKGRTDLTKDTLWDTLYEDYIQTNAFINPGNSGSPLFDLDGKVVGMNTLINGTVARGLSFAIPSNICRDVGLEIIATGKVVHPWLGITILALQKAAPLQDQVKGIDHGVVVQTIEADTPAYWSDLRPADIITAVDGVTVATERDLQQQIRKKKVGQSINLSIWRGGAQLEIALKTAGLPNDLRKVSNAVPQTEATPPAPDSLGIQLQDVTKELADELKFRAPSGALVTDVAAESPAAAADLRRGDVITDLDEKPVANAAACKALLAAHDPTHAILLLIDRKGQKRYAVVKTGP
jgi:serine protease Do